MKLCVLASGSRGNAIYIEHAGTAVLIDQGLSFIELTRRMDSRNLDINRIAAILVTHEHTDHIKSVGTTSRKLKVPVYSTQGTLDSWKDAPNGDSPGVEIVTSGTAFSIGDMEILPYSVSHDATEPVQYCVQAGKKKTVVATDLGFVSTLVEHCMLDADCVVIEANHDPDMLQHGPYPWPLKQRIKGRRGHLSNRNAAEILFNIASPRGGTHAILAHLSDENNTAELALSEVRDLFESFDKRLKSLAVASQTEATDIFEF